MLLFYCSLLETKYGKSRIFSILRKKLRKENVNEVSKKKKSPVPFRKEFECKPVKAKIVTYHLSKYRIEVSYNHRFKAFVNPGSNLDPPLGLLQD